MRALVHGSLPASRERVLVVDDSPAQRHYVADCLARQGFEVVDRRGRQDRARARRRRSRPALIVSDYEMPMMTGFELVHALRRDPELRQIPVIMLTARDSRRDMAQMRAAGASAYLVKPFSQDKCIALVERTLAERRLIAYKEASSLFISEGARARRRGARRARRDARVPRRRAHRQRSCSPISSASRRCRRRSTPRRADRAAQRLLRRDVPDRQGARRRHRQVHRRRDHGDLRRACAASRPPAERAVRAALAMQAAMPCVQRRAAPIAARDAHRHQHRPGRARRSRLARRAPRLHGDRRHREPGEPLREPVPARRACWSRSRRATRSATRARSRELPGLELKGVADPGHRLRRRVARGGRMTTHDATRKIRVLIVDDSLFMRAAIAKTLAGRRRSRSSARRRTARTRSRRSRRLTPDVVTMDFNMPGMNGAETVRADHAAAPDAGRDVLGAHQAGREGDVRRARRRRGRLRDQARRRGLDRSHRRSPTSWPAS